MAYFLGVDLGGTKVDYVLADDDGAIMCAKRYDSPFKKTSERLPDGKPVVLADTIMTDRPLDERVAAYLAGLEADFFREFDVARFERRGWSLCGKTWVEDEKIYMIGGNTPTRLARDLGKGRIGIEIAPKGEGTEAANDGNAAATAQGIYYEATRGIDKKETGYFILGTGFGFGVPEYEALTEIGHIPVMLAPGLLWQECGCTDGRPTACAENFASGRGIKNTAELLISHEGDPALKRVTVRLARSAGAANLFDLVAASKMKNRMLDAKNV
ncbi:MAG: ROK family protein, partial [Desulfobacterales bacterium]|nr:ROK family protein [Desulfobacterales bacterium]